MIDVLWLLILASYIVLGAAAVPFHGDESTLIYMSRDYYDHFIDAGPDALAYRDPPPDGDYATRQELRLLNGTVSPYLYGLAGHVSGFTAADLNIQWDWGAGWTYNRDNGHMPPDGLLLATRTASALVMSLGVVAMFGIGLSIDNRLTAYAASALYALNPALLLHGRRAMMEGDLMAFSLLAVLAAIFLSRHRHIGWAAMLALATAMAVNSKHSGALTIGLIFLALGMTLLWDARRNRSIRRVMVDLGMLVGAGVFGLVLFVILNPAWWGDPVARAQTVLGLRSDFIANQISAFGSYTDLPERIGGFVQQAMGGSIMYFEIDSWASYIGDQITAYESSVWYGIALPGVIFAALIGVGFWRLLCHVAGDVRGLIVIWTLGIVLVTMLLTPFEWQRYYLPAIPALVILGGLGVTQVAVWITGRRFYSEKGPTR